MNLSVVRYTLGKVILCESALLGLPFVVSLIYREPREAVAFLITMAVCLALGVLCLMRKPKEPMFYPREGYVITALSWILISVLGALPFFISGAIPDVVSALFETVSGFTTTGASILSDVEHLPYSILFWRSFTHWIGGMGVLVFILMLHAPSGGSSANLMKAESPGPQVEKLVPRLQSTAKILYMIYIVMTLLQIVFLMLGGMSLFEAATIAFGTAGTGGFGIRNDSAASYSPYLQWVITVFMTLFGVNFSFYFLLLKKKALRAFAMEEVHCYFLVLIVAAGLIVLNTRGLFSGTGDAVRAAAFQVSSIMTTAGFSTVDFDMWPQLSKTILVILMFVGACAGSTGGGMKISRFMILFKSVRKELQHFLHPSGVSKITVDHKQVPHEVVRAVNVYAAAYFLIFAASVVLLSFENLDAVTNFTAVTTAINNVGPGLSLVGPTGNFSVFSSWSKLVLIFDMLVGRLEIFPMLLIFTPSAWKKF